MKLEKIYSGSGSNRVANGVELINQYVFGNEFPKKFVPGNLYSSGSYVYTINQDGSISVYQCLDSGVYDTIDTVHWTPASIDATIRDYIDRLLGRTKSDTYSVDFDYDVYVTEELTIEGRRIILPDNVTKHTEIFLYVDGCYLSSDLGEYDIVRRNHSGYIDVAKDFQSVILYLMIPKNHNAELIAISDVRPTSVVSQDNQITVYIPAEIIEKGDYVLNLYMQGIYISPLNYGVQYDESTGKMSFVIQDAGDVFSSNRNDYTIAVLYSRSKYIHIEKSYVTLPVMSEIEQYRLDLPTGFQLGDCPLAFHNTMPIPYNVVNVEDEVMSITDYSYYGSIGDTFTLISVTFTIDQDVDTTSDYIIVDANERDIPIPLINYKSGDSDILLFRKQGSYINTSRYYKKDGYIHLYDHETSITEGDCLQFQTLNNDEYVTKISRFAEVRSDNTASLPTEITDNNFLLFATDGTYIGKEFYSIVDGVLEISPSATVQPGDAIEYVFIRYNEPYTSTVVKVSTTTAVEDNQFPIPIQAYNKNTDKILVFNSTTGLYIDASRYTVSVNGVATVESGSGINPKDQIDVCVLRTMNKLIYTSSIPYIIDFI